jgi:hypothetical protein
MERKRSWRLGMGHGWCAVLHKIVILTAAVMFSVATIAFAQSTLPDRQTDENSSRDVTQPQGKTGPTETKSDGAPISSPQGETPASMRAAPKGSSKVIRTDANGTVEGAPKE